MPSRRFIAPKARPGNGLGYLTQPQRPMPEVADEPDVVEKVRDRTAMCDEPEAIGPDIVNAQTELARTYDAIRYRREVGERREVRQQLSMEARMVEAQRRAKLRHVDISGEVHVIGKMLERARAGNRKEPAAAVSRLEKVEALLDYRPDLEDAA